MRRFRISFEVSADLLPTLISLVSDSVGAVEVTEILGPGQTARVQKPYAKRTKGTPITETQTGRIALAVLADGEPHHLNAFGAALKAQHFSENTASPLVARLVELGFAKRVGPGTYQRV